jgi:hypothetical protein
VTFDTTRLYELLPAIYRIRDAEAGGALRELLSVVADQIAVVEDDLDRLYDDQFIETCADWVVPYIGDLIGYRAIHSVAPKVRSPRAEVANTIAYRRRKGTAVMLEQLARDVTGWHAAVVEFFQRLATTQYMNHLRPANWGAPDLRRWEPLERLGTPFDSVPRSVDVRRIEPGRGRHNIPNIGIFLWRLDAYPLTDSPAVAVDDRRWRFSPLGHDAPLYTRPVIERDITHPATPLNVPAAIGRRVLKERLADYYGAGRSIHVSVNGTFVAADQIVVCNLADGPANMWAHVPPDDKYAIDPELGRLALPPNVKGPASVRVSVNYACSAEIGGGEYDRASSFTSSLAEVEKVPPVYSKVPSAYPGVQKALDALPPAGGVVEITGSGRFQETPAISIQTPAARVEVRAGNGSRPLLALLDDLKVTSPLPAGAAAEGELIINGLVIAGGALRVTSSAGNALRRVRLRHCTLVPGRRLTANGDPEKVDLPSLIVEAGVQVEIEQSIVGGLSIAPGASVSIRNSIVDATADNRIAYAAVGATPFAAGGGLRIENSTVIGRIHCVSLDLVSNSILLARAADGDTTPPVLSERKQAGCLRFSFVPSDALVPRRHRCQPATAADESRVRPAFTSLRYGTAAYCQLSRRSAPEIVKGADDESEMGAFHDLFQPQRETNLRVRLEEYLRFNLEAGVFDGI